MKRFWDKVNKTTGCWEWTASKHSDGYGWFGYRKKGSKKKLWFAHRVAWELERGSIPSGLLVLHRCDNPSCVRPDHLFLGTNQDNMDDMKTKGRLGLRAGDNHWSRRRPDLVPRGEKRVTARLTEKQVIEIRRRYADGEVQISLAKKFKVTQAQISQIVRRAVWKHI